jgi:hypothetical protein
MSILQNTQRHGNFTSSNIYKLLSKDKSGKGFGTPALGYIEEKKIERRLGRSITTDTYSRDMAWGLFLEQRVFSLLPEGYSLESQTTDIHPTIDCWAGSKDLIVKGVKVSDIKCYQPKNFAQYSDAIISADLNVLKDNFPKEYWQLVSNAIINEVPKAEAICYMPYKSEIPFIQEMAYNYKDELTQWKYRFIYESQAPNYVELAYLPDGCSYKNLNIFEFTVPQEDIDLLTEKVLLAKTFLS